MKNLTLGFAQWTAFFFQLPLLNTCEAKDLIAFIAFLGIKDKSKADIALEIIWGLT